MAIKTRKSYLESLRKLRPNIYKFGELIKDVTTHPATKRTVESHVLSYVNYAINVMKIEENIPEVKKSKK